jgi:hypothetical protein
MKMQHALTYSVAVSVLVLSIALSTPASAAPHAACTQPWDSQWVSQTGGVPYLNPGETTTVSVQFMNTGCTTWDFNQYIPGPNNKGVVLGTSVPEPGLDQPSPTGGGQSGCAIQTGWWACNRPARQTPNVVAYGQIATFTFTIKGPTILGRYNLYVRPVVDGVTWLRDQGVHWEIDSPKPPVKADSWYVSAKWYQTFFIPGSQHSVEYDFGYNMANNGGSVILQFGAICKVGANWGVLTWQYGCIDYSSVWARASSIQSGYRDNPAHTLSLELVLGVNSSGYVSGWNYNAAGQAFATTVASVTPNSLVTSHGALDAETEDPATTSWAYPTQIAQPFAQGYAVTYNQGRTVFLYHDGYLNESSWNVSTHTPFYPYQWTAAIHNQIAWDLAPAYPYLQQYNSQWAVHLEHLDQYSYYHSPIGRWQVDHVLAGETFQDYNQAWEDVLIQLNTCTCTQQKTSPYIKYLAWHRTLN